MPNPSPHSRLTHHFPHAKISLNMKFKQFFFFPVALMAAFFLAYCTKEQQPNLTPKAANPNVTVDGRAAKCQVTVTVLQGGPVSICGTNTQLTACSVVNGVTLRGVENLTAPNSANYGVFVPTGGFGFLELTNTGTQDAKVEVTSTGGSQIFNVGAGADIVIVTIDEQCNVL
jgi:hypothetical protein